MRWPALLLAMIWTAQADAAPAGLTPGMPVPQFSRPDFAGNPVEMSAYRGKVVLIDFWASWCAPCLVEMPHLIHLQNRYRSRGLRVIGISMDDSAGAAKAVVGRFPFNYPLLLGDTKLGLRFGGILGLPEEMLVGRDGKILHVWRGEIPAASIDAAVKAATG
jgi:peroxiredoxin